jgi:hypothetical protein
MSKKWLPLVVGALVAALSIGALAIRPVFANSQTASTPFGPKGQDGGPGADDTYLAQALNITTDQLQAAYQKAFEASLAQAVKDGKLTQEQADQMKSGDNGKHGFRPIGGKDGDTNFNQYLADALGISLEKLQAAQQTAFNARLAQAVTDGKMTQEQADLMKAQQALFSSTSFKTAMQSAYTSAVQQAVSDGVITQAQADLILKNMPNLPMPGGPGGGFGSPRGHGGGPGMGGPDGGGNNGNSPYPAPTSVPSSNGGL